MPDDKSLGKRILGLFVESAPAEGDPDTKPADDETPSAADEIAAIARQSAPASAAAAPPGPAPSSRSPMNAPATKLPAMEPVAPAKVDFDAVFKNAGIDPQALDRVRKAEDLLKNLPDSASEEVKRQIVEASLKAFGFEISKIVEKARGRFEILDCLVIHRYGRMLPGDPIVLVSVIAVHRDAAFEAARLIMDYLKTDAPFWKKEIGASGERWIEPRADDHAARAEWAEQEKTKP